MTVVFCCLPRVHVGNVPMKTITTLVTLCLLATTTTIANAEKPARKKPRYSFVECNTLKLKQGPVLLKEKPGGGFLCWSGPQPKDIKRIPVLKK